MRSAAHALSWLTLALGCAGFGASAGGPVRTEAAAPAPAGQTEPQGEPYRFQAATRSPQAPEPAGDELGRACPARDAALDRTAAFLARRELDGHAALEAEDVALVLRAEGSPYVWPHAWMLSGASAAAEAR